jgi:hypothetical protein
MTVARWALYLSCRSCGTTLGLKSQLALALGVGHPARRLVDEGIEPLRPPRKGAFEATSNDGAERIINDSTGNAGAEQALRFLGGNVKPFLSRLAGKRLEEFDKHGEDLGGE